VLIRTQAENVEPGLNFIGGIEMPLFFIRPLPGTRISRRLTRR